MRGERRVAARPEDTIFTDPSRSLAKLGPVASALPTALVCDDEPATTRAVEAILRRCGFDVLASAPSAAEALRAAAGGVDVVVVDLALTGDRGLGVIEAFHAARPGCAVVVLSPFDSLHGPAMDAGAFAFVATWPADPHDLERCLHTAAGMLAATAPVNGSSASPMHHS